MKSVTRFLVLSLLVSFVPVTSVIAEDAVAKKKADIADLMKKRQAAIQSAKDKKAKMKKKSVRILSVEEARDLVMSKNTAQHAVGGTVVTDPKLSHYDLYARQMAYREHAKDLRVSLDVRRENFDAPRNAALEDYRELQQTVYAAESEAYNEKLRDEDARKGEEKKKVSLKAAKKKSEKTEEKPSEEEKTAQADDGGLKEQPVPTDESEGKKKKVITSDDAPDFDPSNL